MFAHPWRTRVSLDDLDVERRDSLRNPFYGGE
jgi:hypothetical protein